MTELTDDQIDECKEAFSLFEKDGDGVVAITQLGALVCLPGSFSPISGRSHMSAAHAFMGPLIGLCGH